MGQFIRHPKEVPLTYTIYNSLPTEHDCKCNIRTYGGIYFRSKEYIKPTSTINIHIPLLKKHELICGFVAWCYRKKKYYKIGVKCTDRESEFRIRMVEQVCYIENYKNFICKKEKRNLSEDEAAKEWICKYAQTFPTFL